MLRMFAYLSPMEWPCIYSRCFTSWMVIRILSHWCDIFLILDLIMDIESAALFRIISFPYWWDNV